jgi:phosphoribosylformylglycinamidine synthase
MMPRRLTIGLAFAAAALATYLLVFRVTDAERIRREIASLADAMRIDRGERDPAVRPLRIRRTFQQVLAPRVDITIEGIVEDTHPPDELAGMAISAAETFADLRVRFDRLEVEVDPSARRARVRGTATVSGMEHDGRPHAEVRGVAMRFEAIGGEWRLVALAADGGGPEG